jgi:SAM-dependent methyltransferase
VKDLYTENNLLDRVTDEATLQVHYHHLQDRERELLARRLPLEGGDVLSVGCGPNPGRHLFPAPRFHLTGVDVDPEHVEKARAQADEATVGAAGRLAFEDASFDVVLYRLVLHHVAYQGPLGPVFAEAARLLRPGGAAVAIEPGLWHPVGAALAMANRNGALATRIHGSPDDIPLSPRALARDARAAGLEPELHALTYTWRRMPARLQRALQPLDRLGSRPRAALLGHHLLLIARKAGRANGGEAEGGPGC